MRQKRTKDLLRCVSNQLTPLGDGLETCACYTRMSVVEILHVLTHSKEETKKLKANLWNKLIC